ncbi:hypothetical protein BST61_g5738 [Cercospora zeina]
MHGCKIGAVKRVHPKSPASFRKFLMSFVEDEVSAGPTYSPTPKPSPTNQPATCVSKSPLSWLWPWQSSPPQLPCLMHRSPIA